MLLDSREEGHLQLFDEGLPGSVASKPGQVVTPGHSRISPRAADPAKGPCQRERSVFFGMLDLVFLLLIRRWPKASTSPRSPPFRDACATRNSLLDCAERQALPLCAATFAIPNIR
jgi:hypothetical protein